VLKFPWKAVCSLQLEGSDAGGDGSLPESRTLPALTVRSAAIVASP
jgi:hypothetical protein